MQLQILTLLFCALSSTTALPPSNQVAGALSVRDNTPLSSISALEKRKGGGGGSKGGSSSGSSGGKTGSGSSSGSGRSYSSSSNVGGQTRDGSGTPRAYGNKYAGGASVPYTAGAKSPTRSVAPYFIGAGALAFFPGIWLYSVYAYPYPIGYHWYDNGRNRTSNATCLCQEYSVCGCDPTDNSTFLADVLTNSSTGTGAPVNTSLVQTVDYNNGTVMSYINGTLDNGTTAPGGTDPSNDSEASPAVRLAIEYCGYWAMVATVIAGVMTV